jgi:hypothetical protein
MLTHEKQIPHREVFDKGSRTFPQKASVTETLLVPVSGDNDMKPDATRTRPPGTSHWPTNLDRFALRDTDLLHAGFLNVISSTGIRWRARGEAWFLRLEIEEHAGRKMNVKKRKRDSLAELGRGLDRAIRRRNMTAWTFRDSLKATQAARARKHN